MCQKSDAYFAYYIRKETFGIEKHRALLKLLFA